MALATSRWVPPPVLLGLVRASVGLLRRRIRQQDRRQDARRPAGAPAVYCIDGYHGGITFWDWLALPQGGFWYEYCWNLVGRLLIDRALARPSLHTIFDIDGHTFEEMARKRPQDMARLAQAAQAGAIEVVNGTYGQPLSLTVSGEAIVRHFYYGLRAIEEAIGVRVDSFLSQEPLFFPQMPQVLAGFGFRRAVLRTHWAPFGSDPGVDADVVRWRAPDGSEIPTAPRYAFTDYGWLRPDHRGLEKGGLTGGDLARWGRDQLDGLRRRAEMHGVARPLLSRVADFHVVDPARPDAPLANARALVGQGARFLTVREYFQEAGEEGETATWDVDDMPSTIPWGLGAELLQRARTDAEGDLLAAERLDAIASALGMPSQAAKLDDAWKNLLHAQHHDLHVCGPWHSRPHAKSMAEVGADLAWLAAQGARVGRPCRAGLSGGAGGHLGRRRTAAAGVQPGAVAAAGVHPARRPRRRPAGAGLPDGRPRLRRGRDAAGRTLLPGGEPGRYVRAPGRRQATNDGRLLDRLARRPLARLARSRSLGPDVGRHAGRPSLPGGGTHRRHPLPPVGYPSRRTSRAWSSAWSWTSAPRPTSGRSWKTASRARPTTWTTLASSV